MKESEYQTRCGCGELSVLPDMTECQFCEETKCVDCFTMDEDAEMCDQCIENRANAF